MRTDIGHFCISYQDKDYELIPSFKNIRSICEPSEMPAFFASLFGREVSELTGNAKTSNPFVAGVVNKLIYSAINDIHAKAALVIQCCCEDDTSKLTGFASYANGRKAWRAGVMNHENVIHIARSLLTHGLIGVIDESENRSENESVSEIDVYKYVEFAVEKLSFSYERAEMLTKTEFDRFFDAQYPEAKKQKKNKVTLNDHKQNIEILKEINKRREAAKAGV